nr:MAG TPA: restriction alleviation protein [Caudoviricetes sp.]
MNKTPELLPCPFCGKDDELRITHIYEGEDYIGCDRCKYDGVHITVWNTRMGDLWNQS